MIPSRSTHAHLRVARIDWARWTPQQTTTLLFVVADGMVVLMRKKRGLGAGRINAPGGRLEPGESARECAIRETREELRIDPRGVEAAGEVFFHAEDTPRIHCYLFTASGYEGTPSETDEAIPLTCPIDRIPYDEMWDDNRHWLPLVLAGERVTAYCTFYRERLVDHRVDRR
ncbi:MAG: 8-oxo-dGTP diphosphatase [bacterium]|nr:8-oxo-dGTP diphosphatase [Myxococcales bacterium]